MRTVVFAAAAVTALALAAPGAAAPPTSLRVLFLGSSLTATNDLPAAVARIAARSLPESQANLRQWTMRWAVEIRAHGATPALLTVWPESYRRGALGEVIRSYRRAAEAARAELLPAGGAWRTAWGCAPVALYGPDGFHPSTLATYTAALVVYGRLFRAPVRGAVSPAGVRARTPRLVQWSAATALGRPTPPSGRCGRG